jgi:hypothetical protein
MIIGSSLMMIALTELPTGRARYVVSSSCFCRAVWWIPFPIGLVGDSILPAYKVTILNSSHRCYHNITCFILNQIASPLGDSHPIHR